LAAILTDTSATLSSLVSNVTASSNVGNNGQSNQMRPDSRLLDFQCMVNSIIKHTFVLIN
jgi:hypothetical protein